MASVLEDVRNAFRKLARMVRPAVTITDPPAGIVFERDVPVVMRDGVTLRVNVFRPEVSGRYPVLLCAHPYGKDRLPSRARWGGGYRIPKQYRLMAQSEPLTHSAWTSWEAPDPAHWVPRGYVVVNADLRGWGHSEGTGELLSEQEGIDCHDLIEWAAARDWSNGRVGMTGVSYLAITQWAAAATRPPHLAAINPWEGFTDAYRDFAYPGGIREDGFTILWSTLQRLQRRSPVTFRRDQKANPLDNAWWRARNREIERIDVPALVCASFSDHNLHARGSFDGFRRIGSERKWLYTHRGPKWATYYGREALAAQERFFDQFLRGDDTGMLDEPTVRLEIREDARTISSVRGVDHWPPREAVARRLYLSATHRSLENRCPEAAASLSVEGKGVPFRFEYRFDATTDVVGPMWLTLYISTERDDLPVFAGVRKVVDGREVGFEGSYGFDRALVTHGWLLASHRDLDEAKSTEWEPYHPHDRRLPLSPGAVMRLDIGLLPSATRFHAGETLVLELRDRWFFPRNPLLGQFPAGYLGGNGGRWNVHTGPEYPSALRIPALT